MQQEKNRQQLEELDTLEGFVQLGCNLPYGPYILFKRLANRYPLHFIRLMDQHRYGARPEGAETLHRQLPIARADVRQLSEDLEHYLTHEPRTEEERTAFQGVSGKLENRLWLRHFRDPRFTHFLDIDQYTDAEGVVGIESLFYYREGDTLHIRLTDSEGAPLGAEDFTAPRAQGSIRSVLAAYLLHYFSKGGNHGADNAYVWSNLVSRRQFEELRQQGLAIIDQRKEEARRLAKGNELIAYCAQQGLSPRPEGSNTTYWYARCPSGGHHTLMISTASNGWGCGYCRKKGGLEELKQWIVPQEKRIP